MMKRTRFLAVGTTKPLWSRSTQAMRQDAIMALVFGAVSLFAPMPLCYADTSAVNVALEKPGYKFGAFPMIAVGQIDKVFSPVAAEFARILGRPVHFRTKPSFAEFRQELSLETYDIAVVQPFDYVLAHDSYHYLPLARFDKPLRASVMVLSDSPLRGLQDLKGTEVAFPPTTAAATIIAKKAFQDAGFNLKRDFSVQYTKSHDSCLHLVMVKSVSACVTSVRAAHVFEAKWGQHFRSLFDTPGIPNTLFIVHRRVPKEVRDVLLKTITAWPESSQVGREFIEINNQRLVPAVDAEYDVVREFPQDLDKE